MIQETALDDRSWCSFASHGLRPELACLYPKSLICRKTIKEEGKKEKKIPLVLFRYRSIPLYLFYSLFRFLLSIQIALFDVLSCRVACHGYMFEVVMIDDNDGSR